MHIYLIISIHFHTGDTKILSAHRDKANADKAISTMSINNTIFFVKEMMCE